ncbi:MAG: non-ribosomal peptide synthetase [Candidatus Zhuqueibacterota bacterium]
MSSILEQLKNLSPEKRELLELLLREKGVDLTESHIVSLGRDTDEFPLSFGQQRLWFLDQLEPGSPLYNNPAAVYLKGPLNTDALENALKEMVDRHEVLRTVFSTRDEKPVQVILNEMPLDWMKLDLRHLTRSGQNEELVRLAKEQAQQPFDLSTGPLFRVGLLQLEDAKHLVLLTMHHVVSDAWSLTIFIREIALLYEAFCDGKKSPLPALKVQYADYASWQHKWLQGKKFEEHLEYWRQKLADIPPLLNLTTDYPRPSFQTFNGKKIPFTLSRGLTESLEKLAKQEDATLFMVLLAGLNVLLNRYTHQDDIAVGTPIANRNRVETESIIGFFINTLVMRTDLSGNPTVRELIRRMRDVALGAYANQDMPFELLVEKLQPERDMSRSPFFQVMFNLMNAPAHELKLPNIVFEPAEMDSETAKFDLTIDMLEDENGKNGWFIYNTDLFAEETIKRMASHYMNILEDMVRQPDTRIRSLRLLTDNEKTVLLEQWNRPGIGVEEKQERLLPQLFEMQTEKSPDTVAVVFENERLTYRALNQRANQLTYYLKQSGVGPETIVGVYLERPLDMIVSLLAIFKSGGVYLPLDPAYPKERLDYMIADSRVPVVITQQRLAGMLPQQGLQCVNLDADFERIASQRINNPEAHANGDNTAYMIYTSGSTGNPKGVQISYIALANHCLNMKKFYDLTPNDHVLQFASFNFDASLEQILPTLLAGAQLVLRGVEVWSPEEFRKNIKEYGLTVINPPTAYWRQLVQEWTQSADTALAKQLRLVIVGGDLMTAENVTTWGALSSDAVNLLNAYGPTEVTITSTIFKVPDSGAVGNYLSGVPIGRPTALRTVYILDSNLNPVPVGVPGELYIGGSCLARGYFNRPEMTAERFIPDPYTRESGARLYRTGDLVRFLHDGNIDFLGRVDNQVKVRGFRIELGEIEAVLSQNPMVDEAVIVALQEKLGGKQLVAYMTLKTGTNPEEATSLFFRNYLREKLPEYMIPTIFIILDELPRTPIGKIDRRALPAPDADRAQLQSYYVAPRTAVEERIAAIWAEALTVEKVGIHDNFFDLGGHSLMATQIISRLRHEFQVDFPLRRLFETPTVANLAMAIAECQAEQTDDAAVTQMLDEIDGMSDEEVELLLKEEA